MTMMSFGHGKKKRKEKNLNICLKNHIAFDNKQTIGVIEIRLLIIFSPRGLGLRGAEGHKHLSTFRGRGKTVRSTT